jgi:hypothetical protein
MFKPYKILLKYEVLRFFLSNYHLKYVLDIIYFPLNLLSFYGILFYYPLIIKYKNFLPTLNVLDLIKPFK